jgi:hypothetical protein
VARTQRSEKNMRTRLIVAVAAAVTAATPGFAAEQTPTAFVGSLVEIAKIDCESDETVDAKTGHVAIIVCMDEMFRATYRVEQVLEGKLVAGLNVTFSVADHFGFPRFAEQKRALIYLGEHEGSYYHIKYKWGEAYRTTDGDFARCGCDEEPDAQDLEEAPGSSSDCRVLSFSPAVTRDLTHASRYFIDNLRAALDYKIQGNHAECVRGLLVEDVYKRRRPDLMEYLNKP